MNREITRIVRQYPKTDDCKFETLKELWNWQIREITKLIKQAKDEERKRIIKILEDYDVNDGCKCTKCKSIYKAIRED